MERWHAKLLALVGSFVLPLIVTLLPYKLSDYVTRRGDHGQRVLSWLMCFGGGIFFGTYLLHMGPDVQALLRSSLLGPYDIRYPVPDLLTGIGFFLVLFSEKLVLRWNERRLNRNRNRKSTTTIRDATVDVAEIQNGDLRAGDPGEGPGEKKREKRRTDPDIPLAGTNDGEEDEEQEQEGLRIRDRMESIRTVPGENVETLDHHHHHHHQQQQQHQQQHHHHHHHHSTRSIILIVALSMHRIFEGMTIGLQDSVHSIWSLFLAVMCHELVIGFSLGLQLVKSRLPLRRMTVASIVCSAVMPVGVTVGVVLTEAGGDDPAVALANGVLQAVAMGTFVYVTFFEILQEEVDPNDTSLAKIFFIFAGFVMMALLDLIPEEDPRSVNFRKLLQYTPVIANVTEMPSN